MANERESQMAIRAAAIEDLGHVLELLERMHAESPRLARLVFSPERAEQILRPLLSWADPRCATFVSHERNGAITGFASVFADTHAISTDVVAAITMFYVLPTHRGRSNEERLACVMKAWASQRRAKWVETGPWIDVAPKHIAETFGRFGYRPIGGGLEAYPPVDEQVLEAKPVWLQQENREVLH